MEFQGTSAESFFVELFCFFSVFIVLSFMLVFRNWKSSTKETFPIRNFIYYAIRALLGKPKISLHEVFMRHGSSIIQLNFWFLRNPIVIVTSDFELVKSIMTSTDKWINRPYLGFSILRNGCPDRGILLSSGEVWKETKRFTVKTLTQLGLFNKTYLEQSTNEQLQVLLGEIDNFIIKRNNKVPVKNLFSLPTINIIWKIIGGDAFSGNDKNYIELRNANEEITKFNFYEKVALEFFKTLLEKGINIFRFSKIHRATKTLEKHFRKLIFVRQQALLKDASQEESQNFTDSFLKAIAENENKATSNIIDPVYNKENLLITLFDLFEAGIDTTSSTLEIALMCLVMNPDVQEQMYKEIQTVVGLNDLSYFSYRNSLPYVQAVIHEVHRVTCILPLISRSPVEDCYLNGTFIKKGTPVVVNVYSAHYDVKYWKDPYNFRPNRFLDDAGQISISRPLIHFGGGKRACPGESIARIAVFKFLVGTVRKYKIQKANPDETFELDMTQPLTSRAKPFHARFIRRSNH